MFHRRTRGRNDTPHSVRSSAGRLSAAARAAGSSRHTGQPRIVCVGQSFEMHCPLLLFRKKAPVPKWRKAIQGRERTLPCYHLALRRPRGRTPQWVCDTLSPVTAGKPPQPCRRAGSVRDSEAIFRCALRIPLAPSGIRLGGLSPRTFLFIVMLPYVDLL